MVRQTRQTEVGNQGGEAWCTRSPKGLVPNVHQGPVPSPSQSLARAVATEVVRPPIAVRRMERSDGHRVTEHDRSHRPDRVEHDTVAVDTWSGRLVPHTRPQGFKRRREDGVPATQTCAKVQVLMREAVAKVEGGGRAPSRSSPG
jgi:hypothetical protein